MGWDDDSWAAIEAAQREADAEWQRQQETAQTPTPITNARSVRQRPPEAVLPAIQATVVTPPPDEPDSGWYR